MWRRHLIKMICHVVARIILASQGVLFINDEDVEYDYTPYLGQDWKPTYDNAGSIISNHQSYLDILVHMLRQEPSYVAKASIKNVPFVGPVAEACGTLFVDRGNKESKNAILDQIIERQKQCEQGLYPSLIIHPEGGTTNGTYLISFKKGAFAGLKSVQPEVFSYSSPFVTMECCVCNFVASMVLTSSCPYANAVIKRLPVFAPNEFFFKNHQREGEDKVETYMRVVRQIMADVGGLKTSDIQIEEKFKYRDYINRFDQTQGGRSSD